ncbi:unnamed protein product [Phytophthora lilii]|uniref:Unnamed protein product n=1 Tax=Phytophthora lilii TaxID=2077276 RepID=A0A9W6TW53_9STRA|nr:unnamed protein product [Phytophthora lilii]
MSDSDDEDFSLGEEDSEDEPFAPDEDEEEEEEDFAEESAASDASDLEELAPKPKKARVSPKKPATKKTPSPAKPKARAAPNASATKKTATQKTSEVTNAAVKAPAAAKKSPAAPKPKPMNAGDAEAAVLDYMRKELVSKTYGKAKIYYMNQNNLPVPSEEERLALEEQIKTVGAECTAAEQELKSAEATLAGITSQISDADLDATLKQLDEEAATLEEKVETLDRPDRAPVSPGRKDAMKRKFTKYRTAWVARKRIAMDGINQIADGMEKKTKAVLELVGVETDEEAGIKELPTI